MSAKTIERECAIIVMDSTPLIELAMMNQLDLLLEFDLPIYISDEIYYECVSKFRDKHGTQPDDAALIESWIAQHDDVVTVLPTDLGKTLAEKRASGTYKDAKNYGEMTATQVFDRRRELNRIAQKNELAPVLLIYNDADIPMWHFASRDVHFLSTYGLLLDMQKQGFLKSAIVTWNLLPEKQKGIPDKSEMEPRNVSNRGDSVFSISGRPKI